MKKTNLYIVSVLDVIKVHLVACSETAKTYKVLDTPVLLRSIFKKENENIIIDGAFYGSFIMYSTYENQIDNMKEKLRERAIKYHTSIISKHEKTLNSIKG